jgi:hypothetical protein
MTTREKYTQDFVMHISRSIRMLEMERNPSMEKIEAASKEFVDFISGAGKEERLSAFKKAICLPILEGPSISTVYIVGHMANSAITALERNGEFETAHEMGKMLLSSIKDASEKATVVVPGFLSSLARHDYNKLHSAHIWFGYDGLADIQINNSIERYSDDIKLLKTAAIELAGIDDVNDYMLRSSLTSVMYFTGKEISLKSSGTDASKGVEETYKKIGEFASKSIKEHAAEIVGIIESKVDQESDNAYKSLAATRLLGDAIKMIGYKKEIELGYSVAHKLSSKGDLEFILCFIGESSTSIDVSMVGAPPIYRIAGRNAKHTELGPHTRAATDVRPDYLGYLLRDMKEYA